MTPYYSDGMVQLYCGDMREVLPALDITADAIVTDPPYGETSLAWDRWPDGWPSLVAQHANSMWCFGSLRMFTARWGEFADWKLSQDVVWEKPHGTMFAADRFRRVHELTAHFYRGKWSHVYHDAVREAYEGPDSRHGHGRSAARHKHTGMIGPGRWSEDGKRIVKSVIRASSMWRRGAIHPTEKPSALLSPLIEYAVPVGGLVLDPFAGSASTLLTARMLGRRAIGVEAHEPYAEAAARRLDIPDLFGGAVA